MRAEIVGVGTEILLGQIANSNARWMSERLAEIGVDVVHHQVVGDNVGRIADAFQLARSRSDVVISTGGLGPTQDDITRQGLAASLRVKLVRDEEIGSMLKRKFERLGREMPESNLVQADVPEGCRYIAPKRGTAPGLACSADGIRIYAVPGVPAEMREMMEGFILPELAELAGPAAIVSRVLRCTGIAESKVAEMLDDLFSGSQNPTVAYLASSGEVKVRLTAKSHSREGAEALIWPVAEEVARRIGDFVFTDRDEELEEALGRLLRGAGKTLACAESLTGGGVASRITAVAGASEYFVGSAVCYSGDSKRHVLGVREETLGGPGEVSGECAIEMARGAREIFNSDIAVALTGAAGPGGLSGAPPGQVFVAIDAEGVTHVRGFRGPGDRAQVRRWAEQAAMDLARRHLAGLPFPD